MVVIIIESDLPFVSSSSSLESLPKITNLVVSPKSTGSNELSSCVVSIPKSFLSISL